MFLCSNKPWIPLPEFLCPKTYDVAMCNTWSSTNRDWLFLSCTKCCSNWKLLGWNSCTEAFKPLTTWKYSKLWILLHSIWWPLHIFLIVLCGIVLHSMSRRNNKIEKSTGFKQMYKLWVMIYENFKNMYERLKNTTLFTIHVLTCKLY